ncbi:MAG: Do family serine endopeptidase [Bryobacteraceae bacterium]|nr:Do family serine endopeptidase [Bryobacteraceae bacterium]
MSESIRKQRFLGASVLLFTLSIGILIGTLITTGVRAEKGQPAAPDATPLVIPSAQQLSNEFTKLAKKLEPSVVYITTQYNPKPQSSARRGAPQGDEDDDEADMLRRFFGNPRMQPPRRFKQEASGSGVIVDKNGYILTNHHVVDGADSIRVKLHGEDGEYKAKLIGSDVETDLAVLKIDAKKPLSWAKIGNSDGVQVGDWAVAIGSPFGLQATVTAGIISALGRDVGAQQFQKFLQTDAAINPGNSGGPLLNINGEIIGINTAIATQNGGYQGIGFALPINQAAKVYNAIIASGKVTRGSIGVGWRKYEKQTEMMKALGATNGVLVDTVQTGGPAEKAGIKPEDILIALNGKPIKDGDDLVNRVSEMPIGTDAAITVDRGGKKMEFKVTIADREEVFKDDPRFSRNRRPGAGPEPEEEATQAKFGIRIRGLSEQEAAELPSEQKGGVRVTFVEQESFADEIGLQDQDVIASVNRQPVSSVDDLLKIQKTLKPGDAVAFRVYRPAQSLGGRASKAQYQSMFVAGTLPNE